MIPKVKSLTLIRSLGAKAYFILLGYCTVFGSLTYSKIRDGLNVESSFLIFLLFLSSFLLLEIFYRIFLYRKRKQHLEEMVKNFSVASRNAEAYSIHFSKLFKKAHTLELMGISNERLVTSLSQEMFDDMGQRRVEVRVLFPNPSGVAIELRELDEGREPGWLSNRINHSIQELQRKCRDTTSRELPAPIIKIRFYDSYPSINICILDKESAFFHPYLAMKSGYDAVAVFVSKSDDGTLFGLDRLFTEQWEKAAQTQILCGQ